MAILLIIQKNPMSSFQLERQHQDDAGMDIRAAQDTVCPPGGSCVVSTDLFVAIPKGYVGIVKSRSGLSFKNDIEVGAGVIDSGYRGEVRVKLYNFGKNPFVIHKMDRIAQMIVLPFAQCMVAENAKLPDADDSRGTNGFGSTGV